MSEYSTILLYLTSNINFRTAKEHELLFRLGMSDEPTLFYGQYEARLCQHEQLQQVYSGNTISNALRTQDLSSSLTSCTCETVAPARPPLWHLVRCVLRYRCKGVGKA